MGLFSKKNKKVSKTQANQEKKDLIVFDELTSADDSKLTDLAKKLISGQPLVLNFKLLDIDHANKAIAFLSGVVFAINGFIYEINEAIYLFGDQSLYEDGTIKVFLDEL